MSGRLVDHARIRQWARARLPVLRRWGRAAPAGIGLAIVWCATSWTAVLSFVLILLPKARWGSLGFLEDDAPVNRAICFFICLISVWVAGLMMRALDAWWKRLHRPEQAALNLPVGLNNNLRAWLRRAARTAARLYGISCWIMTAAVGSLMFMNASRDPEFVPTLNRLTSLLAGYFGAAGGTIMLETSRLPPVLGVPAGLLFISFFFFGCWKLMKSEVR